MNVIIDKFVHFALHTRKLSTKYGFDNKQQYYPHACQYV